LVALVRAQISAPSLAAGASRGRELLAVCIRTCEATEIGTLAGSDAGDEKRHVRRLGRLLRLRASDESDKRH
jgi:hypothetical protein